MERINDNLTILNEKIKKFIRQFYLNRLFKGLIFFLIITLFVFIIIAVLEYFSFFSTAIRTVIFYSYIFLFIVTLLLYVLLPLLKMGGLGKQLSKDQVAEIIGKYFSQIDDKLLNIIQLENKLSEGDYQSYQLLLAAIDTKIEEIKPFSFIKAIPFQKTKKYIKWAVFPVLLFIILFSFKREIFTESTARIVHHNQYFEKPAPYSFEIVNEDLIAFQNDNYTLKVKIVGDQVPQELFITMNNKSFKCLKNSNTEFSYVFTKVQKDIHFQINTEEVVSKVYTLSVLPKPVTISFVMELDYPAYLNKNKEIITNNGDATVPEGTTVTWKFYTKNTDTISFFYRDQVKAISSQTDYAAFALNIRANLDYAVLNKNEYFTSTDTFQHTIFVVKDQYPEIHVESQRDSLFTDRIYFKGNIKDDYGFTGVKFVYSKTDDKGNVLESEQKIDIPIQNQSLIQDFYYYFDAASLDLKPGYKIDYYFEVKDNDAINGFKSARTSVFSYRIKTMEEIDDELKSVADQSKSEMSDLMKQSDQLIKDIEKLNQQLMQTKNPSWQDKKKLESLIEQYNELQKALQDIKRMQEQQSILEDQFKNIPQDLLEKQKELQKRMDEVLSDELKAMLEKMQDMMDNLNKDQMREAMDKMKLSAEELNKSMDQQLQLFKQLEFEKKANEIVDKIEELSSEEKQLMKETQQKNSDKENLIKKQEDIMQKFDQLKQDIKSLDQLNKELEDPNKMTNTDDLQKKIEDAMKESRESLNKNNKTKASQKQKESAEDLDKLADQIAKDMLDNQEENLAEDIESLRQLLDNLIKVSFQQEENMLQVRTLNPRSAQLNDVVRAQFAIQEHMKMVDDSLSSIARSQPQVQPFILKEVTKTRDYLAKTQTNFNDRRLSQAASNQQFVLTSMNNLALMLAESISNMKEQLAQAQECKKDGSCSKPGNSGKSGKTAKSARELQQQLNRQMEALKRSMEQQGQEGGEIPSSTGSGQQQISEQLAKMAAQQEAIRKMIQDLQGELKSQDGVGNKSLDQLIKDMEATERDLVNRRITQQTISRQKNIETRLLESEKAQMEREKEEKRESIEARDIRNMNPPKEWQMDKMNEKQNEMLKTVPLNLNYYYKEKVNQYFSNIE